MDVKEAIGQAKRYVSELFADDGARDIMLEEVEFDDMHQQWRITIGLSRPRTGKEGLATGIAFPELRRSYKVVTISDTDARVLSVKNRETVE